MLYQHCVGIGYITVLQCTLHERCDLIESASKLSRELAWCTDEIEKARRVHLDLGVTGQSRKLLGVILRSCDDKAHPVFRSLCWRVSHLTDELSDKLARRFVTTHEIRGATNREGEHE